MYILTYKTLFMDIQAMAMTILKRKSLNSLTHA